MVMEGGPGMASHTALLMVLQQGAPSLAWVLGQPQNPLPAAENTSQIYLRHIYKMFFIESTALMKNFVGNKFCDPE